MKNNSNILVYFLSRSLFLGGGLSLVFLYAGKDTYISAILGILLGIIFIYIWSKLNTKINMPIHEYLKKKSAINLTFKIIYFLYLIFLAFMLLIIISIFIYSYFLPFTPSIISCLPLIFLATCLNSKSIKNLTYVASILFVISTLTIILKTLLLTSELDTSNLFPIMSTDISQIFIGAFIYFILSVAPLLTMLGDKVEFKETLKYYLIAGIANIIVLLSITLVMGDMIKVYSYPEYSVLRKIRFFDFIENIENIISANWFYDVFMTLSLVSLKLKETINTKKSIFVFILISIIMYLVHINISNNFYKSMLIYKIFPFIFLGFIIIITILLIIKKLTKKQHQS